MKLNVPYYPQSTEFTCDPACLMMAIKFFRPTTKLCRSLEFEIWREAYGIGIPGCMPQGLAYSALKRGLGATIICKKEALFECSMKLVKTKEEKEVTIFTSKELYKKARRLGMKVKFKDPTIDDIHLAIEKNSIPLVMVHAGVIHKIDSPHWIIVTGIEKEKVWVNDPLKPLGKKDLLITTSHLNKMMNDLKAKSEINKRILVISGNS
jgi:ABC-type bacteriocin/lantibiotic exporter with double-glycine peptidase domain